MEEVSKKLTQSGGGSSSKGSNSAKIGAVVRHVSPHAMIHSFKDTNIPPSTNPLLF